MPVYVECDECGHKAYSRQQFDREFEDREWFIVPDAGTWEVCHNCDMAAERKGREER